MRRIETPGGPRYELPSGQLLTEEEFDAMFAPTGGEAGASLVGFKPLHSEALAVHPSQRAEAEASAKAKGVPVDFDGDGRPVFTSSRQFREYAKRYGFRHKSY